MCTERRLEKRKEAKKLGTIKRELKKEEEKDKGMVQRKGGTMKGKCRKGGRKGGTVNK